MVAETIDLCQNYHEIVRGYESESQSQLSDIRNYYMSDSLLDVQQDSGTRSSLIEKAVFNGEKQDNSAYLTAMTKAYFADGNADHALKFFEEGF